METAADARSEQHNLIVDKEDWTNRGLPIQLTPRGDHQNQSRRLSLGRRAGKIFLRMGRPGQLRDNASVERPPGSLPPTKQAAESGLSIRVAGQPRRH